MSTSSIGVIGLGYVGTAVQKGFETIRNVVTFDIAKECNTSSIQDVVAKSRIIFICVPTPMNPDGSCNISIVSSVLKTISECQFWLRPICVIKSTVPPKTTKQLAEEFKNIILCFNPEFLTERNYIEDFERQNRIILGHTGFQESIYPVMDLYTERFPRAIVYNIDADEAEMIKYVSNTMLAAKVAFLNEIHQVCNKTNINYNSIASVMRHDKRLGISHWQVPGPDGKYGFGGTCFPKDLNALIKYSEQHGQPTPLLNAIWQKNLEVRPEQDWQLDKGRAVI
jgi:nucleotide sugar dehydrogenase